MSNQRKKPSGTKKPAKPKIANRQSPIENKFIEIVNWKKAQPNMPLAGNDWMKLYTSLLEHDGFAGLDDSARMTIVALWLYAARSGMYILPADPKWIRRRIPILNGLPVLEPLLSAKDAYGKPTPFLAYCQPPGDVDTDQSVAEPPEKKPTKKRKRKTGTAVAPRTRGAQREKRESREERREKREDETLTGFGREKKIEKKKRINSTARKERVRKEQTAAEEPENPKDSEAGSAKALHIVPRPTCSANSRGPQRIGNIIAGRFPDHWQDPDAEAFGWEIVEALGMPHDPEDQRIRSEWGAFASWWSKVKSKSRASPSTLDFLRAKAIDKARFVNSSKARAARNKSAVWFKIMAGYDCLLKKVRTIQKIGETPDRRRYEESKRFFLMK